MSNVIEVFHYPRNNSNPIAVIINDNLFRLSLREATRLYDTLFEVIHKESQIDNDNEEL